MEEEMNKTLSEESSNQTTQNLNQQYLSQGQQQQFMQKHTPSSPSLLGLQHQSTPPPMPPQAPPLPPNLFPLSTNISSDPNGQQIQLVPIGDIQILDNIKNLFPNNNIMPIRTISLNQFGNGGATTSTTLLNGKEIIAMNGTNLVSSENAETNGAASTAILPPPTTTFKILNSLNSNFVSNGATASISTSANIINPVAQNQQIFSLDSSNGLTPILIATTGGSGATNPTSANTNVNLTSNGGILQSSELIVPIQIEMDKNNNSSNSNSVQVLTPSQASDILNSNLTINTNTEMINDGASQQEKLLNLANLEEMSVNQLREECIKRKLPKTGVKQKLIDRLKANLMSQQLQQSSKSIGSDSQLSSNSQIRHSNLTIVKSPDSGVNMDGSPSFVSCKLIFLSLTSILINKLFNLFSNF
jgi:hypothetical protein